MDKILQHLHELQEAIDDCLARRQHFATLILIYAAIDIVASIESKSGSNKPSFMRWAHSYLIPAMSLDCTALELYAARCGILHSMTAESDLSRSGQARAIYYGWGDANSDELNSAIAAGGNQDKVVVLNVEQLRDAFLVAVVTWANEVRADSARLNQVNAQSAKWFTNIDPNLLLEFTRLKTSKERS
jgi:hypothetical protein